MTSLESETQSVESETQSVESETQPVLNRNPTRVKPRSIASCVGTDVRL